MLIREGPSALTIATVPRQAGRMGRYDTSLWGRVARGVLIGLTAFTCVGAIVGSIALATGSSGLSSETLSRTPFETWTPSALLLVGLVGGSQFVSLAALIGRRSYGRALCAASGAGLVAWIVVQVALIGLVSFFQPVMFIVGLAEVVLAGLTALPTAATSTQPTKITM